MWVDTSGPALEAAIAAGPTAVKPNEHELAAWAGTSLDGEAARLAAARRLHEAGIAEAVLSAGAEGVLWVSRRGAWQALPPAMTVASTVGAGDTLLAALLHGVGPGARAGAAPGHHAVRRSGPPCRRGRCPRRRFPVTPTTDARPPPRR